MLSLYFYTLKVGIYIYSTKIEQVSVKQYGDLYLVKS